MGAQDAEAAKAWRARSLEAWAAAHPVRLGALAFLLGLFLASVTSKAWPGTPLDAVLALPRHLRIDAHGAPGTWWALVVPMALFALAWRLRTTYRGAKGEASRSKELRTRPVAHAKARALAGAHPRETGMFVAAVAFALFLPPPGILVFGTVAAGAAWLLARARRDHPSAASVLEGSRASTAKAPARREVLLFESWLLGLATATIGMSAHAPWLAVLGLAWAVGIAVRNALDARRRGPPAEAATPRGDARRSGSTEDA